MLRAAGRSPQTIRLHRHYLNQLMTLHDDPRDITTADLLDVLSRPTWGPECRKSARSVYRGFFRWARSVRLAQDDPAADLPSVRVSAGTPRPTPEPIAQAAMQDADPRIAFMAMLAGLCGLRAGEIAQVHSSDWDASIGRLLVHGKGRRERSVPIVHHDLAQLLDAVEGWAFPGRTDGHLSPGHVSRLLSEALPGRWTAHTLRHRAGTRAYQGTHDVLAVSRMLGHARTETTQRYVQMDDGALVDAMNAAAA
jgi:integrase